MISSDRIVVVGNSPDICVYDIPSETELVATYDIGSALPLNPVWRWAEEDYPGLDPPIPKLAPPSYSYGSGLPMCCVYGYEMGMHLLHLSANGIPVREHYYTFPIDLTLPYCIGHSRGLYRDATTDDSEDQKFLKIKTVTFDNPIAVGSIEIIPEGDLQLKRYCIPSVDPETGRVLIATRDSSKALVCLVLDIV